MASYRFCEDVDGFLEGSNENQSTPNVYPKAPYGLPSEFYGCLEESDGFLKGAYGHPQESFEVPLGVVDCLRKRTGSQSNVFDVLRTRT
eukprot:5660001-Pyramimonas_sp.AAC.1